MKNWKNKIYYSQCWEDPVVLMDALDITPGESVLSVTSGGCNTLALLLGDPESVVALDINPAQNHLLELKMVAIKNFEYKELLCFVGVSSMSPSERVKSFEKIKKGLSEEAQNWWRVNQNLIRSGILHAGKFERYLSVFRGLLLPTIHSRKMIHELFELTSLADQKEFYYKKWNSWRWRFLFKIFFSRHVMSLLGRNQALFKYTGISNIGEHYLEKTKYAFTEIPIQNNFFMEYIMYGTYRSQERMPPYLQEKNFNKIKEKLNRIKIVSASMQEFLANCAHDTFTGSNLSDIFEALSVPATNEIFMELVRVTKGMGRLVYWNNLVERKPPDSLSESLRGEIALEKRLDSTDRIFFYDSLHVKTVIKQTQ